MWHLRFSISIKRKQSKTLMVTSPGRIEFNATVTKGKGALYSHCFFNYLHAASLFLFWLDIFLRKKKIKNRTQLLQIIAVVEK